jgi:hypothetical protein
VCLSLLGTWHGGAQSEKWNPSESTLYQVLVSIQGMIFVEQPFFNEPGYEGIRGSPEGDAKSREYNQNIQLHTLRYAMVAVLQKPPPEFAAIVRRHFALLAPHLRRQGARWVAGCVDVTLKSRMAAALADLHG